ncbi:MAG: methyltransferase domain-containing protein [Chloroflexi bacterium]|nr:methyltransferase domain-containing protein [Chloroflexota bacterium]
MDKRLDWHSRFLQQAAWTKPLRDYLAHAALGGAGRVLEAGCGTGAVLMDLDASDLHGLDLDPARLTLAQRHSPAAALVCGDTLSLPYRPAAFDAVVSHFLLLWLPDPQRALREMKRVTRPGGCVLAMAEPDYSQRVDEPHSLAELGRWQAASLRRQGADPDIGPRLAGLFHQAGIRLVESGPLRQAGQRQLTPRERELEWAVLSADLAGSVPADDLQKMRELDEQAWQSGKRALHVPTWYAWGQV